MAGELFKAMSYTDIVHVPHKASGDARNSVMAGNVQMMFDAITTMSALAKAGKVRALATTGLKRSELTPTYQPSRRRCPAMRRPSGLA